MKVLSLSRLSQTLHEKLEKQGFELTQMKQAEVSELSQEELKDYRVLIGGDPDELNLDHFTNLKLIQLGSHGVRKSLAKALEHKDIILTNFKGGYAIPIAEFVVARLLEVIKQTEKLQDLQNQKKWEKIRGLQTLEGKAFMFLGTGDIARQTAKRLKAFDVKVYGVNTQGRQDEPFDACYDFKEAQKLLPEMDGLVVSLPLTDSTRGIVDEAFLKQMKEESFFINVARGPLVNEKALIHQAQRFKAIILDVTEVEPLAEDSALWDLPNVYLSAHTSWISPKNKWRYEQTIEQTLMAFKEGKPLANQVDVSKGY